MLADLDSSVLEHHPLNGMLADFPSTPVLTGATFIYHLPTHGGLNGTLAVLVLMSWSTPTTFIACSYGAR